MNKTNNGGPAFPVPLHPGQSYQGHAPCDGMTLRDFFATHAPAVPEDFGWIDGESDCVQRIVRWNWCYADAMLAARGEA